VSLTLSSSENLFGADKKLASLMKAGVVDDPMWASGENHAYDIIHTTAVKRN
jgi:hypothetical protein